MQSMLPLAGETNHRWKYTTGFSGTEDDEAYEGASCRESRMYVVRAGRSEGEAMREDELAGHIPETEDEQPQERSFGCLFCITGKEQSIVDQIQTSCPDVRATAMRQLKYRTCKKVKTQEEAILLPSYVFFEAPSTMEPSVEFPRQNIIRILSTDDGMWQLQGEDERFVKWLFQYDGLLGFSQAYKENDRIRIISGPLKDMEGKIKRVDKRGKSGQVVLSFYGKEISVWLGFELIESIQ